MRACALATATSAFFLGATLLSAAPFEKQFTVAEIFGPCTVQPPGKTETQAVKGMSLPYGTAIKTGRRSSIVLELSTGNRVRLLASSAMVMMEDEKDASSKTARLTEGRLNVKFETDSHKHNRFMIETPTAICGIVGCNVDVEVGPGGTLSVSVIEGLVNLSGQTSGGGAWHTQLTPGDTASVTTGGGQQAFTIQAREGGFDVIYTDAQGHEQTVPVPTGAGITVSSTTVTLPNGTTAVSMIVTVEQPGGGTTSIVLPPVSPRYPGQ